jgi:hypothetical protein
MKAGLIPPISNAGLVKRSLGMKSGHGLLPTPFVPRVPLVTLFLDLENSDSTLIATARLLLFSISYLMDFHKKWLISKVWIVVPPVRTKLNVLYATKIAYGYKVVYGLQSRKMMMMMMMMTLLGPNASESRLHVIFFTM